jgi:5'-deoxynucleotidase YfbR-like HD superfamily hydrolase
MDLIKFFEPAMNLKNVERMGWIKAGVQGPETSADHSLMVALMVLVLGKDRKLNLENALKMALIHDLPEALTGDIITKDKWERGGSMWRHERTEMERKAMKKLCSLLGDSDILQLWEEFDTCQTEEAQFVEQIDRVVTIVQAIEYHKKGNYKKPLPGFWDEKALSAIKDAELRKFVFSFIKSI